MLLTIPWFGGLILGRVDIIGGVGRDGKCSRLSLQSLWKQVLNEVFLTCVFLVYIAISILIGSKFYPRCHIWCDRNVNHSYSISVSFVQKLIKNGIYFGSNL